VTGVTEAGEESPLVRASGLAKRYQMRVRWADYDRWRRRRQGNESSHSVSVSVISVTSKQSGRAHDCTSCIAGWCDVAPDPEDMRKLLIRMVRELVDNPDAVSARMTESGNSVRLLLRVHPSDAGKIIGARGRDLASLREILDGLSAREGRKYILDVDDCDAGA
jgi:uncharacterized protein